MGNIVWAKLLANQNMIQLLVGRDATFGKKISNFSVGIFLLTNYIVEICFIHGAFRLIRFNITNLGGSVVNNHRPHYFPRLVHTRREETK